MINHITFVCPQFLSIENKNQLCYKKINQKRKKKRNRKQQKNKRKK